MRKTLLALILFLTIGWLQQVTAQTTDSIYLFCYFKGNGDGLHYAYSNDGLAWKAMFNDSIILQPTVSKDKLFRDPCILKGTDGRYHMVWTVSWADKGIGYASSTDLLHWSAQQFIPVMAAEDSALNTWAPEITYNPAGKDYIIYWSSTITGRFPQKDTSAEGRKYNHRLYYTTTKDFKTFGKTALLYQPNFSVIDASIVPNGKQYVMFLKNETRQPAAKNLRIATAKNVTGPWSAAGPPITGKYWAEGPTSLRIGGKWLVYFDKYINGKYGAVQSADLVTWTDISNAVSFPPGVRHGTAFVVSKKEFAKLQSGGNVPVKGGPVRN